MQRVYFLTCVSNTRAVQLTSILAEDFREANIEAREHIAREYGITTEDLNISAPRDASITTLWTSDQQFKATLL